ncbi:MAG: FG-GAP repeat domain-containing protein [Acidimicrobiales bacterium]
MTSDAPPGGRVAVLAVLAVIASAVAFVPAAVAPDMDAAAAPAHAAPPAGQPLTGDFDGDRRVDIFWYGPGSAPDHHWYGQSNLQFGGRPIAINRTYQPIIGDFDGDRRSDIFWYAPGSASDIIYYGTSSHGFAGKATPVHGRRR